MDGSGRPAPTLAIKLVHPFFFAARPFPFFLSRSAIALSPAVSCQRVQGSFGVVLNNESSHTGCTHTYLILPSHYLNIQYRVLLHPLIHKALLNPFLDWSMLTAFLLFFLSMMTRHDHCQ